VRYCIFGGSFDPPHAGHMYLARSARDSLRLDTVFWVPTADPPHKSKPSAAYRHRLAMVGLVLAGHEGQEASDVEETLPRPSYSLRTVQALKAQRGADHAWHFLIGADNWEIIRTWHRWEELLREVTMVVFPRGGRPLADLPEGVLRLDLPELDLEARAVRAKLAATGDPEAAGLPPELREYVVRHGLYGLSARGGGSPGGARP
jgi:nicotinate-nucleotide adenylyltransferase